jgi:hypothetical protein
VVTRFEKSKPIPTFNSVPLIIVLVLTVALGAVIYFLMFRPGPEPTQITLTPEARGYVRNLKLSDVEMKASESYMKSTIVEITGKITNNGQRSLRLVEINCIFYDPYNQVVLRERVPIVRSKTSTGLAPGETRSFRLPFDSLPQSWNQGMPQLVIARIEFEN